MQPTDFVQAVRAECCRAIVAYTVDELEAAVAPEEAHLDWAKTQMIYQRCSPEERQLIRQLLRMANQNSIAMLFRVIDSGFQGDGTPFTLTHTVTGAVVSGDLVDEFWAQEGNT